MSVSVFNPALTENMQEIKPFDNAQMALEVIPAVKKKLYIQTQGCQMNEYDSNRMADLLNVSHGLELTDNPEEADVLIMNTCTIREKAQEKVFSELGKWRKLKQKNPDLIIGVGGCVASQEGDGIQKRAPYVDMVFGPQTLHRLPQMINQHEDGKQSAKKISLVDISFPEVEKFDYLPEPRVEGFKAFVSIMEGCSKYCSFCVVPYTRGEEVSRPLEDVIAEVMSLAEKGVREVNLLGQNVNGYRGPTFEGDICNFANLLKFIDQIPGIDRIRYTTSHPLEFSDELIDTYKELPNLVSHLHLPVQSGSNDVLAAMKRNHKVDIYIEKINKLKSIRPDLHLSSDFIIGFPNETDDMFEETFEFIKSLDFDHSYSFIYSKRPGTPASELTDVTTEDVKKERLNRVKDLIRANSIRKTHEMLDTTQRVLVEKQDPEHPERLVGSADNTRLVEFKGTPDLLGKFVNIKITRIISMNRVEGDLLPASVN